MGDCVLLIELSLTVKSLGVPLPIDNPPGRTAYPLCPPMKSVTVFPVIENVPAPMPTEFTLFSAMAIPSAVEFWT